MESEPIRVIIVGEPPAQPTLTLKGSLVGDVEPDCQLVSTTKAHDY